MVGGQGKWRFLGNMLWGNWMRGERSPQRQGWGCVRSGSYLISLDKGWALNILHILPGVGENWVLFVLYQYVAYTCLSAGIKTIKPLLLTWEKDSVCWFYFFDPLLPKELLSFPFHYLWKVHNKYIILHEYRTFTMWFSSTLRFIELN